MFKNFDQVESADCCFPERKKHKRKNLHLTFLMSNCFSWVGYKAFGVFDAVPHNACILCCHELAFEPAKIVLTINSCYQYQYQYPPSRSIAQPYREPWRVWEQASGADFESRKFSGSDSPSLQVVSRPFNKDRLINKLDWGWENMTNGLTIRPNTYFPPNSALHYVTCKEYVFHNL